MSGRRLQHLTLALQRGEGRHPSVFSQFFRDLVPAHILAYFAIFKPNPNSMLGRLCQKATLSGQWLIKKECIKLLTLVHTHESDNNANDDNSDDYALDIDDDDDDDGDNDNDINIHPLYTYTYTYTHRYIIIEPPVK